MRARSACGAAAIEEADVDEVDSQYPTAPGYVMVSTVGVAIELVGVELGKVTPLEPVLSKLPSNLNS